jgi:hypothetical protein
MLEYFVHLDRDDPPKDLVLATAQIPDGLTRVEVTATHLPAHWREAPAPPELSLIGDAFVRRGRAAILIVPSALAPAESNWLIHPLHPTFSKIKVRPIEKIRVRFAVFNKAVLTPSGSARDPRFAGFSPVTPAPRVGLHACPIASARLQRLWSSNALRFCSHGCGDSGEDRNQNRCRRLADKA